MANNRTLAGLTFGAAVAVATAAAVAQVPPPGPAPTTKPVAAVAPAAPVTPPSVEAVEQQIADKKYADAVRSASKLLALRGAAAEGVSRFQVTMLKAEAQIGERQLAAAVATFKVAASETKDPHELALAHWSDELVHRSSGAKYVPKVTAAVARPEPIDIIDPDSRKLAFAALLDDELSAMAPKIKVASTSQSLVPIWPVIQQVESLDQLDQIANGNDTKTAAAADALLDHARNLLSTALKGMWVRVSDIDAHANVVSTTTVPQQYGNGILYNQTISQKNGLSQQNRTDLQSMIDLCQKIHSAAQTFAQASKDDKDWLTIMNDADRVSGRANDVLTASYGLPLGGNGTTTSTDGQTGGVGTTGTVVGNTGIGLGGFGGSYPGGPTVAGGTTTTTAGVAGGGVNVGGTTATGSGITRTGGGSNTPTNVPPSTPKTKGSPSSTTPGTTK